MLFYVAVLLKKLIYFIGARFLSFSYFTRLARFSVKLTHHTEKANNLHRKKAFVSALGINDEAKLGTLLNKNLFVIEKDAINLIGIMSKKTKTITNYLRKLRLIVDNAANYQKAVDSNLPLIFVTNHYGNFNLGYFFLLAEFFKTYQGVFPLNIITVPPIKLALERLQACGTINKKFQLNIYAPADFDYRDVYKKLAYKLKNQVRESYFLVSDSYYFEQRKGLIAVNFLGRPATVLPAVGKLASIADVCILPFYIKLIFEDENQIELSFGRPIFSGEIRVGNPRQKAKKILEKISDVNSAYIRQAPEQWHWWEDLEKRWRMAEEIAH